MIKKEAQIPRRTLYRPNPRQPTLKAIQKTCPHCKSSVMSLQAHLVSCASNQQPCEFCKLKFQNQSALYQDKHKSQCSSRPSFRISQSRKVPRPASPVLSSSVLIKSGSEVEIETQPISSPVLAQSEVIESRKRDYFPQVRPQWFQVPNRKRRNLVLQVQTQQERKKNLQESRRMRQLEENLRRRDIERAEELRRINQREREEREMEQLAIQRQRRIKQAQQERRREQQQNRARQQRQRTRQPQSLLQNLFPAEGSGQNYIDDVIARLEACQVPTVSQQVEQLKVLNMMHEQISLTDSQYSRSYRQRIRSMQIAIINMISNMLVDLHQHFQGQVEQYSPSVSGLTIERINQIAPHFIARYRSDECAICISDIQKFSEARRLLCGHAFHKGCVDEWLIKSANCPKCRSRFT